ncbi:hypothetical protein Bca52824_084302 [Brassica carinata]|uniref:phosphopyruvate hydratase n=1 Tax=Brassica carinata TaxID=52824 RepID=A0A8X7TW21_BRACI|nr:hypothetical protein Bca52824_084302 [Brassica carinata]
MGLDLSFLPTTASPRRLSESAPSCLRFRRTGVQCSAVAKECRVKGLKARQIIDSRGNPTVEVDLVTDDLYRSAVPSGASTGIYEALELRDGDKSVYGGKGVLQAIKNINELVAPKLIGVDVRNQADVDALMLELDGTLNKSKLGANAILGVSLSVCRAGAGAKGVPLYKHIQELSGTKELVMPVPAFNVINGGSHAGNSLAMQEFMILPVGATSFSEAFQMGSEVYHTLKGIIKSKYGQDACNVGDEGGFAPNVQDNREGLVLLIDAIEKAGYTGKIKIGMDVAASEFFTKDGRYDLNFKKQPNDGAHVLSAESLADLYREFIKDFPIVSIEDPFDQDDWSSWASLQSSVDIQLVNQIGTVTESIQAALDSKAAGWGVMVSHRSGETEDNFIADLSVGLASGQIKTGAPCRSERLSKYNQKLPIPGNRSGPESFAFDTTGKAFYTGVSGGKILKYTAEKGFEDFAQITTTSEVLIAVGLKDASGKLFKYDPATKAVTVLMEGLSGAAGCAVSSDGSFVLVSEFIKSNIKRYWITGPKAGSMEDVTSSVSNPDNIRRVGSTGNFWVASVKNKVVVPTDPSAVKIDSSGKVLQTILLKNEFGNTLLSEANETNNNRKPYKTHELHGVEAGGRVRALKTGESYDEGERLQTPRRLDYGTAQDPLPICEEEELTGTESTKRNAVQRDRSSDRVNLHDGLYIVYLRETEKRNSHRPVESKSTTRVWRTVRKAPGEAATLSIPDEP